eukprot:scaffold333_cov133-Cylindrotheca_fusiformis.AAC.11
MPPLLSLVLFFVSQVLFWRIGASLVSSTELPPRVRHRCRVAYDGSGYYGFQLQQDNPKKEQPTIQGELERVLSQRFNRPVRVVGAGRTDAGVHSRGQAVHFDLYPNETITIADQTATHTSNSLQRTMNRMLPPDIRVWKVEQAHPPQVEHVNGKETVHQWNAMRKCNAKLYSYRLCIGDSMDPIERHCRWQLDWGHEIDPDYLAKILKCYEGKHDFVCFAAGLERNERKTGKAMGTIRLIHSVNLVKEGGADGHYRIDIHLEGALYKMVRNMVGTALDVCRGQMTDAEFQRILLHPENLSRKDNPSKPAPPQGLTLEHVFYPDDDF